MKAIDTQSRIAPRIMGEGAFPSAGLAGTVTLAREPSRRNTSPGFLVFALVTSFGLAEPALAYTAYVTNERDNTVSVVDLDKMVTVKTIPVGQRPRGIAISFENKLAELRRPSQHAVGNRARSRGGEQLEEEASAAHPHCVPMQLSSAAP